MKKILTMGLIALFASSALANVQITEADLIAGVDGSLNVTLDVDSTFIFKVKNDSAVGLGNATGDLDSLIDLGQITAGVAAAGGGGVGAGLCATLTGLTPVASLGVTATQDADTLITPGAEAAQCAVVNLAGVITVRLAIPLSVMMSKSGAGSVDLALTKRSEAVAADFQQFDICDGSLSADAADLTVAASPETCGSALATKTGMVHGHNSKAYLLVSADLSGAAAKNSYSQYVDLDLTPVP